MTQFILVRHASHDLLGVRLAGRMPGVRLSARGRAEAEHAALRLARVRAVALATSPSVRCLETAGPIARAAGLHPIVVDALDEIDFGDWTGLAFADLERDPAWHAFNELRSTARPPGGEAMAHVERRILHALEALHQELDGGTVIVVSHGDVLRAGVASVLGVGLERIHRFVIDPASMTTIRWWGDRSATLVALNETAAPALGPVEPALARAGAAP